MAKKKTRKQTDTPSKAKPEFAQTWKLLDTGSIVISTIAARSLSKTAWRIVAGKDAASNAQHPEISTRQALVFAGVTGAVAAVVRVGIRRGLAVYWYKSTGQLPPGVKPLAKTE